MPEGPERSGPRPLLAAGTHFSGLLVLHGDVRIDGHIRGEIVGADCLRIGETAHIEARVEAAEVVVEGSLEGELTARRRVELRATARVHGSIDTGRLSLADGSVFEGPCRIRHAPDRAEP